MSRTLAVDFGTSNSAVGIWDGSAPRLIPVEPGHDTLPTSVFFDFETREIVFGSPANAALIEGAYGRYMRALKSLLGTSLMRESRMLLNRRRDFIEIVSLFLAEMKKRAEAATGDSFAHALSGRPVRFHSADAGRDAQAEVDLRECYHKAGFESVDFLAEPEAAALACQEVLRPGDLGMIVDIGGGTSDFTLFRTGRDGIEVLINHGIRMGGTNFDRQLSIDHVMPGLGRGSLIRNAFGGGMNPAPNAIFNDLATWQKIPFLYAPDTRRMAHDLAMSAAEPEKLDRLVKVLEEETGHDMAFSVEAAKIAANGGIASDIRLEMIERGLAASLAPDGITTSLAPLCDEIGTAARETVELVGIERGAVTHLILVGGSSLMRPVEAVLQSGFPRAALHRGAALTAIITGLARATRP